MAGKPNPLRRSSLTTGEGNIMVGDASRQGVATDREVPVLDADDLLLNTGGFGSIQTGILRFNDGTMETCQGNITLQWIQGKRGFRKQGNIGAKCDFPEGNGKVDNVTGDVDLTVVGDSSAGGEIKVTNQQGKVALNLVNGFSTSGETVPFLGTLCIKSRGSICLNGRTTIRGSATEVFGPRSVQLSGDDQQLIVQEKLHQYQCRVQ